LRGTGPGLPFEKRQGGGKGGSVRRRKKNRAVRKRVAKCFRGTSLAEYKKGKEEDFWGAKNAS